MNVFSIIISFSCWEDGGGVTGAVQFVMKWGLVEVCKKKDILICSLLSFQPINMLHDKHITWLR